MNRREAVTGLTGLVIGAAGLAACTTTPPGAGSTAAERASRRRDIDAAADATLSRLYATVNGARELGSRARGILIFPNVLQAGLVVGGEYGDGVLRVGSRDESLYRITSASFGWQIGAQSKALVIMFLTPEALEKFQRSKGWTAGVDASVAVARMGANGAVDTNTISQSVVGFALTNAGLMASATLEGSKITRLEG